MALRIQNPAIRIQWHFREILQYLGVSGIIGLALIIGSISLYRFAMAPALNELAELQRLAHELITSSRKLPPQSTDAPTESQRLTDFFERFPAEDGLPGALESIFAIGVSLGVRVDEGRYQIKAAPREILGRYDVEIPLKADYARVRAFVNKILAELPFAALSGLTLQRESATNSEIDATVHLTLFFRMN